MRIMRKALSLVVALFIAFTGYSQVSIDPQAGLTLSKIRVKNDGEDAKYLDTHVGFSAGAAAKYDLTKGFYIKPGVNYTMLGGKEDLAAGAVETTTFHFVTIPVDFGYDYTLSATAGKVFAEVGPYARVGIAGTREIETASGEIIDNDFDFGNEVSELKPFDWGFSMGVGYETPWGIYVKGSYDLGLGNLSNIDDQTMNIRNWNVGIGYRIKF